jgi:uncharacterized protein (DUF2126 family)
VEERRLPSNVTPEKTNFKDRHERERLTRLFQQGLGAVVGYTLPLKRLAGGWVSGAWFLRDDDTLWLTPGDAPMGLRLPLDSIPWVAEKDFPWTWQQDPSARLPALPPVDELKQRFVRGAAQSRAGVLPAQRLGASGNSPDDGKRAARRLPCFLTTAAPRQGRARRGLSARRYALSHAMGACTSSCHPSRPQRIFST